MKKQLVAAALLLLVSAVNVRAVTFHDLDAGDPSAACEMPVWQGGIGGNAKKFQCSGFFAGLTNLSNATNFRAAIGAATGPVSSVNGNVATFSGTGGKTLQDGGKGLPSGNLVGTTDTQTLSGKTLTAPIISSISNTGTVTLPTATDTLVGRATTDTLTNKTISGASNTISGPITGTSTNDNAASGKIGEYVAATNGSNVSLTSGTAKNCTSMSLTAGDWDVTGMTEIFGAGSTSQTVAETSLSTTSNTMNTSPDRLTVDVGPARVGADYTHAIPSVRYSLSSTTTVYLVATATFTVSTTSMNCALHARRAR